MNSSLRPLEAGSDSVSFERAALQKSLKIFCTENLLVKTLANVATCFSYIATLLFAKQQQLIDPRTFTQIFNIVVTLLQQNLSTIVIGFW